MRHRFAAVVLLVSSSAWAQSHRGSLGLTVAAGGEVMALISGTRQTASELGARLPIELGATLGITDKTELLLSGRFAPGVTTGVSLVGASFYAGLRQSFGYEALKTFFELQAAVHVAPAFTAGVRVAVGVQYDVLDVMGVYASLGGQIGGALYLRLSGELIIGVQFRTYLFE